MEWSGRGVILGNRRQGEQNVILEAFTPDHGRHLGLVRGGRSPKRAAMLQPGNEVSLTWRARLEDHLGTFAVEPETDRAALLIQDRASLDVFLTLASHIRLLPERDPHPEIFAVFEATLDTLGSPKAPLALCLFERDLLTALGFGLDLSCCAATGDQEDLIYVSPKSGRAVSRDAGAPFAPKLLALPGFLLEDQAVPQAFKATDLQLAFTLTGFFLDRHVWRTRGIDPPPERARFIAALEA